MNKLFTLTAVAGVLGSQAMAADIKLPAPDKSNQTTLMETLSARHAVRNFEKKAIDVQTLSNILWVAYGANRPDGHRTIPTALNEKDLAVYAATEEGVWLYDGEKNELKQISEENILPLFATQDYMQNVPLVLIYTGSNDENHYAAMHAGSAYQNVGLYAAATDLGTVVRAYFDKDAVTKALGLPKDQHVLVSQAIGYEAK